MNRNHETTRVGVIGCGQIGKAHIAHYAASPHVDLVALADIDEAELHRVADMHGVAHRYTDVRALLARDDLTAVDVCLHNNFHMPATLAALEAGKHVFCEKPMAGSWVDAQTMHAAAREAGLQLSIQNRLFFTPETQVARRLVEEGRLGRLYHAASRGFRRRGRPFVDGYGSPTFVQKRNASGGALYDMGVYHIGQILHLLDNPEPRRISGKTYQEIAMDPVRREASGYDVEELGLGLVRFAEGLTLDIKEAWAIHLDDFGGSYVVGTEGGIRLEPFGFFHTEEDLLLDSTVDMPQFAFRQQMVKQQTDFYANPQDHWIAALQGRVALLPTADIALNCMLISEGIYLSNALQREVTADEVREASVSTAVTL